MCIQKKSLEDVYLLEDNLASLPYDIMAMPNNNDHFNHSLNKPGLEMRDLLELLKDKEPAFYYSDVLIPSGRVLNDFIEGRSG